MSGGNGPVVVLDNGAGTCKIGFGGETAPRRVFPNCSAKPKGERQGYVGDMLLDSKDISQLTLRRPFDRGYLVSWELEKEIWSRGFKSVLGLTSGKSFSAATSTYSIQDCQLLITEPMFNFPAIQSTTEQVVFEEFGFNAFYAAPAPLFSLRRMAVANASLPAAQAGAGVVVDAGFSFIHVVPFYDWQPIMQGVKRIDIGGKAMTNYLKELVTYRSLNMMDEPYLMEIVKESLCFVSRDVRNDLKLAHTRNSVHRRTFVLPDGVSNFRGYVKPVDPPPDPNQPKPDGGGPAGAGGAAGPSGAPAPRAAPAAATEQALVLNNERFMVPELAFHPRDIGLEQAGVTEAVVQAVQSVHPALHSMLYNNVVLTGGLVSCPGFADRFTTDLQPLVPDDFALKVHTPKDPTTCAWEGMSSFVACGQYKAVAMTRAQYEENGGGRGPPSRW